MTEKYKSYDKKPRDGYEEGIISAYKAAGFSESEFQPRRENHTARQHRNLSGAGT